MTRTIASASTGLGVCERATAPANAATAGSRLMRIPKVAAEIWRSAASSSVNGSAEPRTATTSPIARMRASRRPLPPPASPSGASRIAATSSVTVRPDPTGQSASIRLASRM